MTERHRRPASPPPPSSLATEVTAPFVPSAGQGAPRQDAQRAQGDQAYWESVLAGGGPPLRPYGIVRADDTAGSERTRFEGGRERAERLAGLATQAPFQMPDGLQGRLVVLATALAAYLHRVTGNHEVLLGLPVATRSAARARASGPLAEQLFLRVKLEGGDSFAVLAARVRSALREALLRGHGYTGDRQLEYASLHLLPAPPGASAGAVALAPGPAHGDGDADRGVPGRLLGLVVHDFAQAPLEIALDFHRATFGEAVRRRATSHFVRVLDALAAGPEAIIDAVDLLEEPERAEVLRAAEGADSGTDAPDLLVQLAGQARRRPGQRAVEAHDGNLTFAELEARSNQLARRLRKLGVVRESLVGVALPRGAGELVALLATLKAGGAYVPIDPTHPVDRVRVILEDATPEVLIAPPGSALAAAAPAGTRHLRFDDLAATTAGEDASPLPEVSGRRELAYLLFTSGTTGRPKGVEVLRGALANFLRSMAHTPGLEEHDRLLAVTTTTFDIAGLELFLPLWVGATVVIADRETTADPRRLREALERRSITMMQATPTAWRLLIESGWKGDGRLRMLCGGEGLPPELAARLLERGGALWNMYGPTETTIWSTADRVEQAGGRITIGRPIDGTQVYVLDSALRLVPVGVVGQLFIGGEGLARGYRGRPELTARAFLPSPFGGAGQRLYGTGDLGRLLPDGRFECLGRADHQVKVRGFRIEPAEVESALRAVPGVQEVVVLAAAHGGGEPVLAAYWVGEADRASLLEQARRMLPSYMVPSAYMRLEALPLTTSGKVDRNALPPPEPEEVTLASLVRPRSDLEAWLAAIWSDVLGVDAVGVDQDFFSLGGTSLLAIQARARIERELGVELPLRVFFECPTVLGVAGKIERPVADDGPIVVRLRRGREGLAPLFCLAGVQLYQDLAMALEGERAVFGMHVPVRYDPAREPCPGVPEIARLYVELIRRHRPEGPYVLAGLCFGGIVAFEVARQLEAAGQRVPVVAVFDGHMPGAMRIDQLGRLRGVLRKGLREPMATLARLGQKAKRWSGPAPAPSGGGQGASVGKARAELLIDGPEADAQGLRYGAHAGRIDGQLLIFRATGRVWPPWIELAPDLGWGAHATRLQAFDIAGEHLDIMRGQHARTVAAALDAAMQAAATSGGGRSP